MILTLTQSKKGLQFYDLQGLLVKPKGGHHRVVLSLRDCQVIFLDLPPLKYKDLHSLIEQKLPSHYPHSLEGMVWDFTQNKGPVKVFLAKEELIEQIKEDLGSKTRIYGTAQSLPIEVDKEVFQFFFPEGQDLYFVERDKETISFFQDFQTDIMPLISDFLNTPGPVVPLNPPGATPSLFGDKKGKPSLALLHLIPLLLILFLLGIKWLGTEKLKNEWDAQRREIGELQINKVDESENYNWEETHTLLTASLPLDHYRVLDTLYPYFYGRAVISSFSIQGKTIKIQAKGKDTLNIMDDLKSLEEIEELTLHQIKRDGESEIFSLTVRWK